MSTNFKITPKFSDNLMEIWFTLPNGDGRPIAWVTFPNDKQMSHNVQAGQEICTILKKRIRASV